MDQKHRAQPPRFQMVARGQRWHEQVPRLGRHTEAAQLVQHGALGGTRGVGDVAQRQAGGAQAVERLERPGKRHVADVDDATQIEQDTFNHRSNLVACHVSEDI